MSGRASGYIKGMIVCPTGERLTRTEKLVALVLADAHQDGGRGTFPAVKTMAAEALMDERACRRLLAALERKGVIVRKRGERQGRGEMTYYFFPELDRKGGGAAPLFFGRRGTEGGQKGDKSASPYKEEQEQEQKQILPPLPPASGGGEAEAERQAMPAPAQSAPELETQAVVAETPGDGDAELTPEQLAHLARPFAAGGISRQEWERYYRAENRKAAEAAEARGSEAKRLEELRLRIPDEASAARRVMAAGDLQDDGRKRGLAATIRDVLRAENARGIPWADCAERMMDSLECYREMTRGLKIAYGPKKFYALGIWKHPETWQRK